MAKKPTPGTDTYTLTAGHEAQLWKAADALRGGMDAVKYKHVVLGLIFLKYISDASEEQYERLQQIDYADSEDPDEYRSESIFWYRPRLAGSTSNTGRHNRRLAGL